MYKRINEQQGELQGWIYSNKLNQDERVSIRNEEAIDIEDSDGNAVIVFFQDIPVVQKALQEAYNYYLDKLGEQNV